MLSTSTLFVRSTYGWVFLNDPYIYTPNAFGLVLSGTQLALYVGLRLNFCLRGGLPEVRSSHSEPVRTRASSA